MAAPRPSCLGSEKTLTLRTERASSTLRSVDPPSATMTSLASPSAWKSSAVTDRSTCSMVRFFIQHRDDDGHHMVHLRQFDIDAGLHDMAQFIYDVTAGMAAFLRFPVAHFYRFQRKGEARFIEGNVIRLAQRAFIGALDEEMRHHVEPVHGHLALAAHSGQELTRQIAGIIFLDIEVAMNVADEDFVGARIGGNRLGHALGHVRRKQRGMLRARAINNYVGLDQRSGRGAGSPRARDGPRAEVCPNRSRAQEIFQYGARYVSSSIKKSSLILAASCAATMSASFNNAAPFSFSATRKRFSPRVILSSTPRGTS